MTNGQPIVGPGGDEADQHAGQAAGIGESEDQSGPEAAAYERSDVLRRVGRERDSRERGCAGDYGRPDRQVRRRQPRGDGGSAGSCSTKWRPGDSTRKREQGCSGCPIQLASSSPWRYSCCCAPGPMVTFSALGVWRRLPGRIESEQRRLSLLLGQPVKLQSLRHLSPSAVLYEGLEIHDPETAAVLVRCDRLRVARQSSSLTRAASSWTAACD